MHEFIETKACRRAAVVLVPCISSCVSALASYDYVYLNMYCN